MIFFQTRLQCKTASSHNTKRVTECVCVMMMVKCSDGVIRDSRYHRLLASLRHGAASRWSGLACELAVVDRRYDDADRHATARWNSPPRLLGRDENGRFISWKSSDLMEAMVMRGDDWQAAEELAWKRLERCM